MTIIPNLSTQIPPGQLAARDAWLKSLSRLSAGANAATRTGAAAESEATLSLSAPLRSADAALQQVSHALSFSQTQSAYLSRIANAFNRMSALAGFARDEKIPADERRQYQTEFSQLAASVAGAATKQFNGVSLFSGDSLEVATDANSGALSLPGVSLDQPVYTDALPGDLATVAGAQTALAKLQRATGRLEADRAAIHDNEARLFLAADRLAVGRENIHAAAGISGADAAETFTQFARQNIGAQPGTAMLAQANAMPQSALRLLP